MLIDIHAHLHAYVRDSSLIAKTVLSAHSIEELEDLIHINDPLVYRSIGVHPQNLNNDLLFHIEKNINNAGWRSYINALGEIGFDLFPLFRHTLAIQEEIFIKHIELAILYNLPVIIHQRRSMQYIFKHIRKLSKLKSVIFHSYSGTFQEALSLRKRGVEAYFSVGNSLLWGSKVAYLLVEKLPIGWLLLETDAPFQPMRGFKRSNWTDIDVLYQKVSLLRNIDLKKLEYCLEKNFNNIFRVLR